MTETMAVTPLRRLLAFTSYTGETADLTGHLAVFGEPPVANMASSKWRRALRASLSDAGLFGRGGSGFPSHRKWGVAESGMSSPILVINAMEGEPASIKDRVLLTNAPHLVLEGAELVATAVGARKIVVAVAGDDNPTAAVVNQAISQRAAAGTWRFETTLARPPAGYVTGEESALVNWLGNQQALPTFRPDKSVPLRLGRHNALIHNAETVAHAALIARHGPDWFKGAGTYSAPGTTLVTVSGSVARPGVVEIPFGMPLRSIAELAGPTGEITAVLTGGYGGTWLGADCLDTPYEPVAMGAVGATVGVGVVAVLTGASCAVAETARIARYMASQSAGQCGPCVFGLPAIAADLELLSAGNAGVETVARIRQRSGSVTGRGGCRHPDGVSRLVESALRVFASDVACHANGRPCLQTGNPSVLIFPREFTGAMAGRGSSVTIRRRP